MRNTFQKSLTFGGRLKSDDWMNFTPLPKLQPEDFKILSTQREYLTGEHDRIIQQFRSTNSFLENTNADEIIKRGNQRTSLREIHRVAYLVQTITAESSVVPKTTFELNYAENLTLKKDLANPWKDLAILENYCRFRKPSPEEILRYMALRNKNDEIPFLEAVKEGDNTFSIGTDILGVNYFVKSTVWPGFVNYFRANSNVLGSIYFGFGLKNADLNFSLN